LEEEIMTMSRKDYNAMSKVMVNARHTMEFEAYEDLVNEMGTAFMEDNERFNRTLWAEACGVGAWK
jgi:hypothetical protein